MAKYLPFIMFTVITSAAAHILLKQGMNVVGAFTIGAEPPLALASRIFLNPFVIMGLSTFAISTASHMFVLSRVDVSFAFPFLSLSYVLVAIWAAMFLNESLSGTQMLGIGAIVAGTVLIALK